ncbi:MAG: GNAT family N-acetyltransferase [Pyrinomonadaceae bacterium]|nr:GNAT family N-acetyltransferase [Pyrinomonadaceae bacterium]
MNFQIKITEEKDIALIVNLIREFAAFEKLSDFCEVTEDALRDAMFGESSCVGGLMAFANENPIGYALFYENFASFRGQRGFYLEDLYVKPEFRGRKIGEAFLKKLAEIAKTRNFQRIDFLVLDWNEPAIRFYEKLGAKPDESERHFRFVGGAFENLSE